MEELPMELLWKIGDLLDSPTVWNVLRFVSTRFHDVFGYTSYWQRRLQRLHNIQLSKRHICVLPQRFADFCREFEEQKTTINSLAACLYTTQAHFGPVDAVRLSPLNGLCATGARDLSVSLWHTKNDQTVKLHEIKQAHTNWIWSLEWNGADRLISSGFDHFVRSWRIDSQQTSSTPEAKCCLNSPVLWSKLARGMMFSGTCDSKVVVMDERNWNDVVCRLTFHSTPAIDCVVENTSVYFSTLSQESLAIGDIRMWAKLNEFRWSTPKRSIAKCHELLYVVGLDNDRKHTCITPIDMSIHKQLPKLKLEGEGACRIASSNVTFGLITNNVVRIFSGGTTTNQLWNSEPLTDDSFLNLDYVDNRLTATTTNGKLVTFNSTDRSSFVVA